MTRPASRARLLPLAVALVLTSSVAFAQTQIYRWTDTEGEIHYSQGLDSVPARFRSSATIIGYDSPSPGSSGPSKPAREPGTGRIPFSPGRPIIVTARVNDGGS